jgi:hypothetical protein
MDTFIVLEIAMMIIFRDRLMIIKIENMRDMKEGIEDIGNSNSKISN